VTTSGGNRKACHNPATRTSDLLNPSSPLIAKTTMTSSNRPLKGGGEFLVRQGGRMGLHMSRWKIGQPRPNLL
jgi:hypothetical protein